MVDTEHLVEQDGKGRSNRGRIAGMVVAGIVGLVLILGVAVAAARLVAPSDSWQVVPGQDVQVIIDPGSSARSIYLTLHDAGVSRASELEASAKALGVEDRLQAGVYALVTDSEPEVVVRQLVAGGNAVSGNTFTLIEGWTIDRIVAELADATTFTQAEFQKVLRNGAVTSPLLPDASEQGLERWEGLLFPAKYTISDDATPETILGMMSDEMTKRLEAVDWSRIEALGISRYEAIVVASLIQREAGTDEERSRISSVIHNRLGVPMRLQIDATVIYALGYNPGRVTADHLRIESPYNTYLVDGLPPTPIGTASAASISAAVDPETTEYLFYVLGGPDGSHLFATTYEGHQQNIADSKAAGVLP
ncbi:MAG: endolytic transglycosylase MltG [Acidimicrobiia bacterium]